jgi:hypothetical protein
MASRPLTSSRAIVALAIAAMLLPSCLEFERQTILLKRDTASDTIRVRIIYEGIYSTAEDDDIAGDFETLVKMATPGHGFAVLDPILLFELKAPDSKVETLLAKHAKLENGAFFLNAEKKLSAWQDLRIEKAGELVAGLNEMVNAEMLAPGADLGGMDDETKKLLLAAAAKKHPWIVVDDGGVRVDFFASAADAEKTKEKFLHGFAEGVIEAATSDLAEARSSAGALLRNVSRNPVSWVHRGTALSVALAPADGAGGTVKLDWWGVARYRPNLLEPSKPGGKKPPKLPAKMDAGMSVKKLVDEFGKPGAAPAKPKPK